MFLTLLSSESVPYPADCGRVFLVLLPGYAVFLTLLTEERVTLLPWERVLLPLLPGERVFLTLLPGERVLLTLLSVCRRVPVLFSLRKLFLTLLEENVITLLPKESDPDWCLKRLMGEAEATCSPVSVRPLFTRQTLSLKTYQVSICGEFLPTLWDIFATAWAHALLHVRQLFVRMPRNDESKLVLRIK